jgi:hypothetical protein
VLQLREPFFQKFDTLADQCERKITHARKVATWAGETINEPPIDGVAAKTEHYRHRRLKRLDSIDHQFLSYDHLGVGGDKCARNALHVFPPMCPIKTKREIATLDPTMFTETGTQRIHIWRRSVAPIQCRAKLRGVVAPEQTRGVHCPQELGRRRAPR